MTFEKALEITGKMTLEEKDAIHAMVLTSDEDDHAEVAELLALELDTETQTPTDNILWLYAYSNTLPEGNYETGGIIPFIVNGEERTSQILESDFYDPATSWPWPLFGPF